MKVFYSLWSCCFQNSQWLTDFTFREWNTQPGAGLLIRTPYFSETLPVKKRTVFFLNKILSHHKKESVLAAFSEAWHPFWLLTMCRKRQHPDGCLTCIPTFLWPFWEIIFNPQNVALFEGLEEAFCKLELW